MAVEPSLAGRLEDRPLSRMAPANFLIEAYFKAANGQTDAVLTRAASPNRFRHIGIRQPLAGEQAWPWLLYIYSSQGHACSPAKGCRIPM